jgi:hypothetical protein
MKQRIFTFCLGVCALVLSTTAATAQVRVGVKAGFNIASQTFDNFGELEPDVTGLGNFMLGAIVDVGFTENLALATGLELQGKGFAVDADDAGKASVYYLQVPIHLQYMNSGFLIHAGPYVGFGLFGNFDYGGSEDSESIEFGNDIEDDYAPLDYGIGLGIGYELPIGLRFGLTYDLGLANIMPKDLVDAADVTVRNNVLGVHVGYMFGGR